MMRIYSRRAVFGLAAAGIAAPTLAMAVEGEEFNPTDLIPRRFSVNRFLSLDKNELYDVNLAVRRGRSIIIEGYSRSESRDIIELAAKDPAAARARLTRLMTVPLGTFKTQAASAYLNPKISTFCMICCT